MPAYGAALNASHNIVTGCTKSRRGEAAQHEQTQPEPHSPRTMETALYIRANIRTRSGYNTKPRRGLQDAARPII